MLQNTKCETQRSMKHSFSSYSPQHQNQPALKQRLVRRPAKGSMAAGAGARPRLPAPQHGIWTSFSNGNWTSLLITGVCCSVLQWDRNLADQVVPCWWDTSCLTALSPLLFLPSLPDLTLFHLAISHSRPTGSAPCLVPHHLFLYSL